MLMLRGTCAWLMVAVAISAYAEVPAEKVLSSAQQQRIASAIKRLKYTEERSIANSWTPAKKVAEFICRSEALRTLKKQDASVDKVFLGDEKKESLRLVSNQLLEGNGMARKGSGWQDMTFQCQLDPATGKVLQFSAHAADSSVTQ